MELLLNHRRVRGVACYLVRWRGHTFADVEWLREEEPVPCRDKVAEYDAAAPDGTLATAHPSSTRHRAAAARCRAAIERRLPFCLCRREQLPRRFLCHAHLLRVVLWRLSGGEVVVKRQASGRTSCSRCRFVLGHLIAWLPVRTSKSVQQPSSRGAPLPSTKTSSCRTWLGSSPAVSSLFSYPTGCFLPS